MSVGIQGNVNKFNYQGKDLSSLKMEDAFSVVFNIRGQNVVLTKEQLDQILHNFAELAFANGVTGNELDFRKEMSKTLFAAYKKYEEKEKRKKKKRQTY
jgi:hypothetical protein